eukprot:639056-Heterocapsa_arctica.AAC.1
MTIKGKLMIAHPAPMAMMTTASSKFPSTKKETGRGWDLTPPQQCKEAPKGTIGKNSQSRNPVPQLQRKL